MWDAGERGSGLEDKRDVRTVRNDGIDTINLDAAQGQRMYVLGVIVSQISR